MIRHCTWCDSALVAFLRYLGAPSDTSAEQPPQPQPSQQPAPQPSFSTGRWYAGRERGTKLSQSRVLTEREMEMIELGGA